MLISWAQWDTLIWDLVAVLQVQPKGLGLSKLQESLTRILLQSLTSPVKGRQSLWNWTHTMGDTAFSISVENTEVYDSEKTTWVFGYDQIQQACQNIIPGTRAIFEQMIAMVQMPDTSVSIPFVFPKDRANIANGTINDANSFVEAFSVPSNVAYLDRLAKLLEYEALCLPIWYASDGDIIWIYFDHPTSDAPDSHSIIYKWSDNVYDNCLWILPPQMIL